MKSARRAALGLASVMLLALAPPTTWSAACEYTGVTECWQRGTLPSVSSDPSSGQYLDPETGYVYTYSETTDTLALVGLDNSSTQQGDVTGRLCEWLGNWKDAGTDYTYGHCIALHVRGNAEREFDVRLDVREVDPEQDPTETPSSPVYNFYVEVGFLYANASQHPVMTSLGGTPCEWRATLYNAAATCSYGPETMRLGITHIPADAEYYCPILRLNESDENGEDLPGGLTTSGKCYPVYPDDGGGGGGGGGGGEKLPRFRVMQAK